jgi:dipeptidyl aminopeptidase/acylaminoacyl peptidase
MDPRAQLYVADAAGGAWKRMTELTDDVNLAAWSPDGRFRLHPRATRTRRPDREVATAPAATAAPGRSTATVSEG